MGLLALLRHALPGSVGSYAKLGPGLARGAIEPGLAGGWRDGGLVGSPPSGGEDRRNCSDTFFRTPIRARPSFWAGPEGRWAARCYAPTPAA